MIAVRPGSDAWKVLALVVAHPGKLDAEAIGQRLWRPRLTSTADYLRVRASILTGAPEWSARASKLLGRLVAAGLVEGVHPPQVAPEWEGEDPLDAAPEEWEGEGAAHRALVATLVQETPPTMRHWVGAAPSGHTQRAVADLVEWGVVVHPRHRWPTEAGVALVKGGGA